MLLDGVKSFIRLRKIDNGFGLDWLLAMRDLKIPEDCDIEVANDRMFDLFTASHRIVDSCDGAKKKFASLAAYFNIAVHQSREQDDVGTGASHGPCPWKLPILAASLTLWGIQR